MNFTNPYLTENIYPKNAHAKVSSKHVHFNSNNHILTVPRDPKTL